MWFDTYSVRRVWYIVIFPPFRKWWCIVMWLFICEKILINFSYLHMVYNLMKEISYLLADLFDSAIIFNHLVWYVWAWLEVEYLHICHSVVYMADGAEETHISLSMISRMFMNRFDVYYSTFQHTFFVLPWNFLMPHQTQMQLMFL